MSGLTALALKRPLTIYVLMAIVVLAGLSTYIALPRESFPEIKIPLILVSTSYPGTAPSDMESQVTRKIELELKGLSGLKELRSTSYDGNSVIEVEFNPEVDLDTALQKVREGVDRARPELPEEVDDPTLTDIDFSRTPIMIVTLAGDFGIDRLKQIADDLKDELEAIAGVNLVRIVGGRDREVHVFADPQRLAAYGLGLTDLVETIAREHLTVPGGDVDLGRLNFLVRIPAEVQRPEDIGAFVISVQGGQTIRVRDVAQVLYGFEEETTRARLNGRAAISMTVEKRTGANIIEVARRVRERVDALRRTLPASAEVEVVADQSEDIEAMVRELENNVLSGLALVLAVLFVAMGWRPAVIVAAAIPFSMLISFLVIAGLGYTLNMVVLFSMVLVLGMLVDNAVVTVENIYRHRELGDSALDAARAGTSEVTMPIIASTATTLCAFAPMLVWPGIIGEFMKYLPVTLIIGLSSSLFVALVFNPTIARGLLTAPRSSGKSAPSPGRGLALYRRALVTALDPGPEVRFFFLRNWLLLGVFFAGLAASTALLLAAMLLGFEPPAALIVVPAAVAAGAFALQGLAWLFSLPAPFFGRRTWITDNRARVLYSMGLLLVGTILAYGELGSGTELFPDPEPRAIWIDFEFPPGTNLEAQDALVRRVEALTADTADLDDMVTNVGSTGIALEPGTGGGASNLSRISLNLLKYHERRQSSLLTLEQVRRTVAGWTGARITIDRPQEGPPTGKPVELRLIGEDYEALADLADRLRDRLETLPGLYNVDHDFDPGYPELQIHVDREEAVRAGNPYPGGGTGDPHGPGRHRGGQVPHRRGRVQDHRALSAFPAAQRRPHRGSRGDR
ncbi:MAG: efflux RND transporter permease subunit [Acidobacteriota bacterium]|nr:efflux RND transporter permease subunit [Acidobacteriota bacterium]